MQPGAVPHQEMWQLSKGSLSTHLCLPPHPPHTGPVTAMRVSMVQAPWASDERASAMQATLQHTAVLGNKRYLLRCLGSGGDWIKAHCDQSQFLNESSWLIWAWHFQSCYYYWTWTCGKHKSRQNDEILKCFGLKYYLFSWVCVDTCTCPTPALAYRTRSQVHFDHFTQCNFGSSYCGPSLNQFSKYLAK